VTPWTSPPADLSLLDGEVHVWRASLDVSAPAHAALEASLAPAEHAHAARLRGHRPSERYATGRGVLRELLGCYLGAAPSRVPLGVGSNGKPELRGASLCFNVAHSDGVALYAISRRAVGVDLERIRHDFDWASVTSHFACAEESVTIRGPEDFFAWWTHREAYLKARGEGLLGTLDAPPAPGWWMRPCTPGAGFAGAVAGQGEPAGMVCWQWAP
jgi:4'-phosphopantetheinyl transferase